MARYTEAVCRQCRREGQKLFLKGDRCYTQKCAIDCRGYAPGQHGQGRSKTSEYGSQLREKQKVRRYYGVLEKQLAGKEYVCGDYSIVDMACVGWARGWERQDIKSAEFPNVMAWIDRVSSRPAAAKALAITAPTPPSNLADDKEAQKVLFNQRAR